MFNKEFIRTIFGVDAPNCHVTDCVQDPNNTPSGFENLVAWKGDYFKNCTFQPVSNQYFTNL